MSVANLQILLFTCISLFSSSWSMCVECKTGKCLSALSSSKFMVFQFSESTLASVHYLSIYPNAQSRQMRKRCCKVIADLAEFESYVYVLSVLLC